MMAPGKHEAANGQSEGNSDHGPSADGSACIRSTLLLLVDVLQGSQCSPPLCPSVRAALYGHSAWLALRCSKRGVHLSGFLTAPHHLSLEVM